MKRDYSFNQMSQVSINQLQSNSKVTSQPYYTGYNESEPTWTDKRIEEIKKKYDTPSHRKNQSHTGPNDRSRDHYAENNSTNIYSSSYRNTLKDSITSSNHLRREGDLTVDISAPNYKEVANLKKSKYQELEEEPRFSYDYKEKENSSFMEKFTNIKNSMKIEQKPIVKEVSKYREYPSSKIVPRVQHIDEINLKIKKILDCLHDEKPSKYDQNNEIKSSFLKGSGLKTTGNELEETKILSRQKFYHDREHNTGKESMIKQERYSLSPQTQNESSTKWRLEDKYNEMKRSCLLNNSLIKKSAEKDDDEIDSWFEQPLKVRESRNNRTRSCLGTFKNEDLKLNSGKKLDDEISKINVRIKEFEEEKKKLNINFTPYKYEVKYNRSTTNLADHIHQPTAKPPRPKTKESNIAPSFHRVPEKLRTEADENYSKLNVDGRKSLDACSEYKRWKGMERMDGSSLKIKRKESFEENGETENGVESEERLPKFREIEPEIKNLEPNNNSIEEELKLKTEEGIEERKRKLLETATVTFSRETKRLIENLFEQVKLDEDLRNAKIWYRDLFDSQKQYHLNSELEKNGLEVSQCQFEVTEEEDNPFYSVRESQQSYNCLVNRWIKAENYWKSHIAGQFNLREFEVEKFSVEKVDLEKKGFFEVEDLVRFINMETGTFYRNRDLILVFRRMTRENKLQWDEFLNILDRSH